MSPNTCQICPRSIHEGGGGGGRLLDADDHTLDHFVVPCRRSQYSNTVRTNDFDGQARRCAAEIQSVRAYRMLLPESQPVQSSAANPFSEQHPRQRHLAPQFARVFERRDQCAHPDSIGPLLVRMIASGISSIRAWVAAPSTASRSPSPALRAEEELTVTMRECRSAARRRASHGNQPGASTQSITGSRPLLTSSQVGMISLSGTTTFGPFLRNAYQSVDARTTRCELGRRNCRGS